MLKLASILRPSTLPEEAKMSSSLLQLVSLPGAQSDPDSQDVSGSGSECPPSLLTASDSAVQLTQ